ncbi:MAG: hypothetical protein COB61_005305 [Thiotrichales bacterium]|nr:hypothetical protein [Thiotrichales bacterium]
MSSRSVCTNPAENSYHLIRRGFDLGNIDCYSESEDDDNLDNWQQGKPVLLKRASATHLPQYSDAIKQSYALYQAILEEEECDSLLAEPPYNDKLDANFESLGSSYNEGDDQEIETILFDAIENDKVVAEDLWMKVSWLSFYEEDASLRFRFSFGVDHVEDVAADTQRQHHAALLTEAIFPESQLITENETLVQQLRQTLNCDSIKFVERIIYFNSPDGGAYLHHDRERGHAGVVYAQLSGETFWLALSKQTLMHEIDFFVTQNSKNDAWPESIDESMCNELNGLISATKKLSSELESFSNSTLIHLINETQEFVQQLVTNGHGRLVQAGDIMLLAQESDLNCCWHSVFSLGEESGEALSFAVRSG